MRRKHFEAKAAEFKRVLELELTYEQRKAVLVEIEQYIAVASNANHIFDRGRFWTACGLGTLPYVVRG